MKLLFYFLMCATFGMGVVCFTKEFNCSSIPKKFGTCTRENFNVTSPVMALYCDVTKQEYCSDKFSSPAYPGESTGHYVLYIVLDSLPVLILVPLILFFNINLASGPGHSLVFTYHILVALSGVINPSCASTIPTGCGYTELLKWVHSALLVSGMVTAFFTTPLQMLFGYNPSMLLYALGYVKILIAGVMVVLYLFLATCSQCPVQCCRSCWAKLRRSVRNWRERHLPQRPVFTGVCSVAILMYGNLVSVTFRLLFREEMLEQVCSCNGIYGYFSYNYGICSEHAGSSDALCWKSFHHYFYFLIACIFIGVAVLLSLPFFYHPGVPALVSYLTRGRVQLPRLHRVRPIFDLFQGVYKPKMQFFAGLHLLYRIILWSVMALSSNEHKLFIFLLVLTVILAVHSMFQPFEDRTHNYLEALSLVNVTFIVVILVTFSHYVISPSFRTNKAEYDSYRIIVLVLVNLPLVCAVVYSVYRLISRCLCCHRRGSDDVHSNSDVSEIVNFRIFNK